ncbi:hypothetical protein ABIC87_002451 [Chitinophaga ginsengisegetis]|nr:hypothetical protein [Chitinophaga ginsengisegetis]MDR6653702.1 hypothetical protein [Chitinophaga ginsengisegetis]
MLKVTSNLWVSAAANSKNFRGRFYQTPGGIDRKLCESIKTRLEKMAFG